MVTASRAVYRKGQIRRRCSRAHCVLVVAGLASETQDMPKGVIASNNT
jgi:hypothetical protein